MLNSKPSVQPVVLIFNNFLYLFAGIKPIVEPVSLYEPVYSDGGEAIYVMDQIGDKNTADSWMDEILLKDAIKNLSDREKRILNLRFMLGKTQTEVADEVGISQAQVSRLEKGALRKIKKLILQFKVSNKYFIRLYNYQKKLLK